MGNELNYSDLVSAAKSTISGGSKSFALAGKLFGKEVRDAAFLLYSWCRYCDDVIDTGPVKDVEERLAHLRLKTRESFSSVKPTEPVFVGLWYVVQKYEVPFVYASDLLEGMAMDVRGHAYNSEEDLVLYSYRVAGTVGLMMSHIMGISDPEALKHASDMGTAMQMTNISRDIAEDFSMGRVYLPTTWLKENGVPSDRLLEDEFREGLVSTVDRLLSVAESYYVSGDSGLKYLPLRSAVTISAARHIYAEIGYLVKKRGPRAWDTRSVVSLPRKLWALCVGSLKVFLWAPRRIWSPFRPRVISTVYRVPASWVLAYFLF